GVDERQQLRRPLGEATAVEAVLDRPVPRVGAERFALQLVDLGRQELPALERREPDGPLPCAKPAGDPRERAAGPAGTADHLEGAVDLAGDLGTTPGRQRVAAALGEQVELA